MSQLASEGIASTSADHDRNTIDPRLWLLAAGTFAVGTDALAIAGILPQITAESHVSLASGAAIVSAYAPRYALGAPFLAVLTARAVLHGGHTADLLPYVAAPLFLLALVTVLLTNGRRAKKGHTASGPRRQSPYSVGVLAHQVASAGHGHRRASVATGLILASTLAATLIGAMPATAHAAPSIGADYGVPAGFSSRFATANGVRLHYVIGGSGSPVLLIHGWPETWYEWRKVMPQLAAGHTVIAVDLRGFGWSDVTATGYDRRTLAEDLYQLMRQLGYPKATVVGHDWGAPVGYAYAATHRDAVDRLVIAEGAPDGPWTHQQTTPFAHNPFWFFGFFEIPNYAETVLAGRETPFLDWFYRNRGFHVVPGGFSDDDVAYFEEAYARPGRFAASLNLYRTIDQDIADNAVLSQSPLTIPVMAIGADHGIGQGVPAGMRHVASNVTPVLMGATGHFLTEERPTAFVEIVETFLAGRPVAPAWAPVDSK